jgi:hypothetical protein
MISLQTRIHVKGNHTFHQPWPPCYSWHGKGSLQEIEALAQGEVFHTPNAKNFVIVLAISKMYLVQHLFNEDGGGLVEHLKGDKFHKVVDKFIPLSTSNI